MVLGIVFPEIRQSLSVHRYRFRDINDLMRLRPIKLQATS